MISQAVEEQKYEYWVVEALESPLRELSEAAYDHL